jgi:Ulp1 protease family, C-terminal catalytic domain
VLACMHVSQLLRECVRNHSVWAQAPHFPSSPDLIFSHDCAHRYLENEILPAEHDQAHLSSILFMDPSVMSCLMLSADEPKEVRALAEGLAVVSKRLLLVPITDQDSFKNGSHHWSLLVACKAETTGTIDYMHIDSSGSSNRAAAQRNARELHALLGGEGQPKVLQLDSSPQQNNGYDCGMYCALSAGIVAEYALQGNRLLFKSSASNKALAAKLTAELTEKKVTQQRAHMHSKAASLLTAATAAVAQAP